MSQLLFGSAQECELLLAGLSFFLEPGLEDREVCHGARCFRSQVVALIDFAIEGVAQLAQLIFLASETLSQRGACGFTVSAATIEFVFQFRPGNEPEGDSADE